MAGDGRERRKTKRTESRRSAQNYDELKGQDVGSCVGTIKMSCWNVQKKVPEPKESRKGVQGSGGE